MFRLLLSVLLLIPVPLLANETETTVTETFEDDSTNVISNPSTYTMSTGRIKKVTRTV